MHALLVSALLVPVLLSTTEPLHKEDVPGPLKSWVPWALDGSERDPAHPCTWIPGDEDHWLCVWPAKVMLTLDEKGGHFTQQWHVDQKSYVALPGDLKRWPLEVKVDGKPAVVVWDDDQPQVALSAGDHSVTGLFHWDSVPETLQVPKETGLVDLTVRGTHLAFPNRDEDGLLYLSKEATEEEEENLDVSVQRKIEDSVPLLLTTRISLNVSGKAREVVLGRSLPDGFQPLSLDSPLPTRLEAQGRLRVQIRPGQWTLTLVARHDGPVPALTRPEPGGLWADGEEVWVFEPHPELRLVTVSGVASVDPQQTKLPDEWKSLPAYPLKAGETLQLTEERRGDSDPSPDQLHLTRELWMDFDGKGYSVKDHLEGTMTRSARLTMAPGTELGRVELGGKDQFITRLPGESGVGVEVRAPQLNANADSRVPGSHSDVPAVGWQHDIQELRATLHLPPGWELLHASGVDEVQTTWIHRWTLLDLFVLLISTLAVGRLFGPRWGAVAFVTLGLSMQESDAPQWLWLALLGGEALVRALPKSGVQTFFRVYRAAVSLLLVLFAVSFLVGNVRGHLYPALGSDEETSSSLFGGVSLAAKNAAPVAPPMVEPPAPAGMAEPMEAADEKEEAKKLDSRTVTKLRMQTIPVLRGPPPKGGAGGDGALAGMSSSYGSAGKQKAWQQAVVDLDRSVSVQTGPGLPQWSWNTISLTWSGPVEQGQRLHLYYVSPGMNRFLALVRLVLVALLLWRLLPFDGGDLRRWMRRAAPVTATGALLLALLFALTPGVARAQTEPGSGFPSEALLKELRERLTRQPECLPDCATSGKLLLEATPTTLALRMEISVDARIAVPLPGQPDQWLPESVLVDGKGAAGITRLANEGTLYLPLTPGVHQIVMQGPLPHSESVQLALPLRPHFVQAKLTGWTVAGLHEDGLADGVLQLTRVRSQSSQGESSLQASQLPPFVHVRRTLSLALDWTVDTEVIRASPAGSAIVLEVPLLPGESVTTADVRVVDGKALVNLGAQASSFAWHSTLTRAPSLQLKAPAATAWVEEWSLDVSPLWHLTLQGIPPIHHAGVTGAQSPEFRPWPGETLTLKVDRPEGVPGQTLTLDQSERDIRPGLRSTDETLTFSVRSSRGGQHVVLLPDGAQLQSVTVGGALQPIRQDGRKVTIPIKPGAQTVQLKWLEPRGMTVLHRPSPLDVGLAAVNTRTSLVVPSTRWVLYAGGPRLGPVVLFWSGFLVMLLVSAALSRTGLTPLRLYEWLLLTVGITQVPVAVAAIVAGWLLLLGWRARSPDWQTGRAGLFNLRQLVVVAVTLGALVILGVAVAQGLLGEPDMQVSGNGSSGSFLRWFEDRTGSGLSSVWVLSAPQWLYRVAMLAWALWLARSLLHWLRWGWSSFSSGGLWKSTPKEPPRAAPQAPGAAP